MKINLYIILLVLTFWSVNSKLFAEQGYIIIDEIKVNNVIIDSLYNERLILAPNDIVNIKIKSTGSYIYGKYICNLVTDTDAMKIQSDSPNFTIQNLSEKEWWVRFSGAINPNGDSIYSTQYQFIVDLKKIEVLEEFKRHLSKEQVSKEKAKIAEDTQYADSDYFSYLDNVLVYIISVALILILVGLYFLVIRKKLRARVLMKIELDDLRSENLKLKDENAKLNYMLKHFENQSKYLKNEKAQLEEHIFKLNQKKNDLEDLQIQKDDLFAVVIHDIKNPVSVIKSLVELLTSYDLSATQQQEIIQDIAKTTSRIIALSQEVTKVLNLERTTLELEYIECDICDVINDVCQRNIVNAKAKNQELTKTFANNLPLVNIDLQKVDEIIDNLISNAIKFTQRGGSINIEAKYDNQMVSVSVVDNGLGMTEEDLQNVFKRGAKLSSFPTAGETTTGMGLWIVKRLVELHGGNTYVKSQQGVGSTFKVVLPVKSN